MLDDDWNGFRRVRLFWRWELRPCFPFEFSWGSKFFQFWYNPIGKKCTFFLDLRRRWWWKKVGDFGFKSEGTPKLKIEFQMRESKGLRSDVSFSLLRDIDVSQGILDKGRVEGGSEKERREADERNEIRRTSSSLVSKELSISLLISFSQCFFRLIASIERTIRNLSRRNWLSFRRRPDYTRSRLTCRIGIFIAEITAAYASESNANCIKKYNWLAIIVLSGWKVENQPVFATFLLPYQLFIPTLSAKSWVEKKLGISRPYLHTLTPSSLYSVLTCVYVYAREICNDSVKYWLQKEFSDELRKNKNPPLAMVEG